MKDRRGLAALLLALSLVSVPAFGWQQGGAAAAQQQSAALTDAEKSAAALVSADTIREVTTALAAPQMEGRGTAQPGGDRAAQYIADRFQKLGLKPLGDKGTYLQQMKFKETVLLPETSLKAGDEQLKALSDFVVAPILPGEKDVSGRLAFVGYGLKSDVPKRDDMRGMDVAGKIAVVIDGPPKGVSQESWDKAHMGFNVLVGLVGAGAAGVIITNVREGEHTYEEFADYMMRRRVSMADSQDYPPNLPPFMMVSDAGAEKLFAESGMTYAQALAKAEAGEYVSQNLKRSATLKVKFREGKGTGSNVVGFLEGSDPKLKGQAVVYSAHYDAWGKAEDGRIYPGAADNALGVAEIVAVAEALTKSPTRPRRSVIFLAVTGEEYGLYGSKYWAKKPTWDIKQVAADINLDGMGTEVYGPIKKVVIFGAEHSDLGALTSAVVRGFGASVIPDPMPEEKAFLRSDHYEFVKKGVPAVMLFGGPEGETSALVARVKQYSKTDYHQPTDVVKSDWNWEGARDVAVIGLVTGMRVANAEQMPTWLASSPYNRPRGTNEPPPDEQ
jgi:hypothetical protein